VTHLRQLMLEELRRPTTPSQPPALIFRTVEHFAGHLHCPPDRLELEHIRQHLQFRNGPILGHTVAASPHEFSTDLYSCLC
jgi:hypothetical protein